MRQDIGEFVTVYREGPGNPIMVDISGLGEELVHWLSVEDARKLYRELMKAADACQVDCPDCGGTGVCRCIVCQTTKGINVDCQKCKGRGKVDP